MKWATIYSFRAVDMNLAEQMRLNTMQEWSCMFLQSILLMPTQIRDCLTNGTIFLPFLNNSSFSGADKF